MAKERRRSSQARPAYKTTEQRHVYSTLLSTEFDVGQFGLQEVLEGHRSITQLAEFLRCIPVMRTFRQLTLSLCVDALVVEHQHKQRENTCANEADLKSMSKNVARRVLSTIEVGSHCSRKIADSDLDGLASSTLGGSSQVWCIVRICHSKTDAVNSLLDSQVMFPGKAG